MASPVPSDAGPAPQAARPSHRRRLLWLTTSLGVAALALLAFGPLACSNGKPDKPSLTVLFTGTLMGKAEPCGCFTGDFGGLLRISHYLEQCHQEGQPVLYFDLGDLLFEEHVLGNHEKQQFPLKSEMILDVLADAGCDAWLPGDYDFANGRETLMELEQQARFPFLLSNVFDRQTGKPIFHQKLVLEVGPWKVGLIGLLARRLNDPVTASKDASLFVGQRLSNRELRVEHPIEIAGQLIPELREECDLVFVLGHVGLPVARRLADEVEGIDAIFTAHFLQNDVLSDRSETNGTHIFATKVKGSRVERVDFYGDPTREDRLDGSLLADARLAIAQEQAEIDWLAERIAQTKDPYDMERKMSLEFGLRTKLKSLQQAEVVDGPHMVEHVSILMDRNIGASDSADRKMRAYHEAVHALWKEVGPGQRLPESLQKPTANYVGYQACEACHPTQYDFWKGTQHSRAYASLEATLQEVDVECFKCHTVGWREPGGFQEPFGARELGFSNVQCENCHGPGSFHSRGGVNTILPNTLTRIPGPGTCGECHNSEHDPRFDYLLDLPKVACPPTPEEEPLMQSARRSALLGARSKVRNGEDQFRPILGRLLMNLGEVDEAVEVLEFFNRDEARSVAGSLLLSRAYLRAEKYDEALELAEKVIELEPDLALPLALKARAMIGKEQQTEALRFLEDAAFRFPRSHDLLKLMSEQVYGHLGHEVYETQWLPAIVEKMQNTPRAVIMLGAIATEILGEPPAGFDLAEFVKPTPGTIFGEMGPSFTQH